MSRNEGLWAPITIDARKPVARGRFAIRIRSTSSREPMCGEGRSLGAIPPR